MAPADWTSQLAAAIAATLREYEAQKAQPTPIAVFHVGCYPWHGAIELSLLTTEELAFDPLLSTPGEVAAWQHYDFGAGLMTWEAVTPLQRQMANAYSHASEMERTAIVETYVRACAEAVTASEVAAALALLSRSESFRISVTHPDTHHEFYPPRCMVGG